MKIRILLVVLISQLCLIVSASSAKKTHNSKAILRVILDSATHHNNFWISYKNHLWATRFSAIPNTLIESNGIDNKFQIKFLPNEKAAYVSVLFREEPNIDDFIIEPGDSIVCTLYNNKWYFTGCGSEKFQCQYDISEAKAFVPRDMSVPPETKRTGDVEDLNNAFADWIVTSFKIRLKSSYTASQIALNVLDWYKGNLSDFSYNLIKANMISFHELTDVKNLYQLYSLYGENNTNISNRKKLLKTISNLFSKRKKYNLKLFPDTLLAYSGKFLSYETSMSDSASYINLKNNYNGFLRDRLLTTFFLNNYSKNIMMAEWLHDALPLVNDKNCKELLLTKANTLAPGSPAFDFSLQDTSKRNIQLKDFKGKIVFMDFWFTGCGGCRQVTEAIKPVIDHFKNNPNIVFIGVSIDGDFDGWKKSVKSGQYSNEGNIDLYTNGLKSKHPIIKHYGYTGYPNLLLIDGNGKIITGSPPRPTWSEPSKAKELVKLIEDNLVKL
jgi:thiol-disulfide isomerase/thioredoxin